MEPRYLVQGEALETIKRLVTIDSKPFRLDHQVETDFFLSRVFISDIVAVVPATNYPVGLDANDLSFWPKNHFEFGLFGTLGYEIANNNNNKDVLAFGMLSDVRLAHFHYPGGGGQIYCDLGRSVYQRLLDESKSDNPIEVKAQQLEQLFWPLYPEIWDVAKVALEAENQEKSRTDSPKIDNLVQED